MGKTKPIVVDSSYDMSASDITYPPPLVRRSIFENDDYTSMDLDSVVANAQFLMTLSRSVSEDELIDPSRPSMDYIESDVESCMSEVTETL